MKRVKNRLDNILHRSKELRSSGLGELFAMREIPSEGKPTGRRDSVASSPEKELCKSCQPRRRSSEDVFWIPFTEKRKASALKVSTKWKTEMSTHKQNGRRKSNDKNPEQGKLRKTTVTQTEVSGTK